MIGLETENSCEGDATHTMVRTVSVLGIFANPKGTDALRLQNEQRLLQQCLALSQHRDGFALQVLSAATVDDVRRALLARRASAAQTLTRSSLEPSLYVAMR